MPAFRLPARAESACHSTDIVARNHRRDIPRAHAKKAALPRGFTIEICHVPSNPTGLITPPFRSPRHRLALRPSHLGLAAR
ncbi:hypothetical protein PMJ11TS3_17520 [Paenibacillus melissococcoides]